MKHLDSGVYQDSRTGNFFERPTINGRRTFRKLKARTLKLAKELLAARRTDQTRAEHGLARNPYAPPAISVKDLLQAYEEDGCPSGHKSRTGRPLEQELSRLKMLRTFFKSHQADKVSKKDCYAYHSFRKSKIKRGTGGRAVDLELRTLSGVLEWGIMHGKLESNPIKQRPTFAASIQHHCRDYMPKDGDELHALAAYFFEDRKSECLGWQLLLEAMTGCRTSEVLKMRWDAANRSQAGFIEGNWLWLARAKGGVNPFSLIHPALRQTLEALKAWRNWRHPGSPWFVPSPRCKGKPVVSTSLTHALKVAGPIVSGSHRTSHGLRAYYVTVRRSQGTSDAQIAAEIGDQSGAAIVVSTYGSIPPNWQGSAKLDWMPSKGEPAWKSLAMPANIVALEKNNGMPAGMRGGGVVP